MILVVVLVIAVVAGALVYSEIADRRKRKKMNASTRLRQRQK